MNELFNGLVDDLLICGCDAEMVVVRETGCEAEFALSLFLVSGIC
jgi:hypothetical protein